MSRRPTVLFVTSALDSTGGIPRYCRGLVEALTPICDLEVLDLQITGDPARTAKAVARALVRMARRPDLLLLGHVGFGPLGLLWRALGRRYVVMAYGIDVWSEPSRSVTTTLRRAHRVWPISTFTAVEVLRTSPRATVAPGLGGRVEPQFFTEPLETPGPFRMLVVSRLDDLHYKGIDTCLDAVARLTDQGTDVQLRVVGSGPVEHELDDEIVRRGLGEHVVRLGAVADDALVDEYRRAGVVVLLSRYRRGAHPLGEGLGLAILEGGAAGAPGIGSAIGGTVDTVRHGETGYLLTPGDTDALVEHVAELAAQPALRRRLSEGAHRFVSDEHSVAAFDARVATLLAEALA